jgi:hypothetical protein
MRRTGEPTETTDAGEVANCECFEAEAWARRRRAFFFEFASSA